MSSQPHLPHADSGCAPPPAAAALARLPRRTPQCSLSASRFYTGCPPPPVPPSWGAAPAACCSRDDAPARAPSRPLAEWPLYTLEEFSNASRLVRARRGVAPPLSVPSGPAGAGLVRRLRARHCSQAHRRLLRLPVSLQSEPLPVVKLRRTEELPSGRFRRRGFAPCSARRASGAGHASEAVTAVPHYLSPTGYPAGASGLPACAGPPLAPLLTAIGRGEPPRLSRPCAACGCWPFVPRRLRLHLRGPPPLRPAHDGVVAV